jgi:D-glycero-D-manno-heptose 1,7-bisphosphate phosphatase
MKLGVFIERDGILNSVRVNGSHPVSPASLAEFKVNTGAAPLLMRLKEAGLMIFVTTNQAGIAQGRLPRRELDYMHDQLRRVLPIDDLFLCPHDESDQCPCRKPKPGLLKEAKYKWQLDLHRSFVISDKWQDAEAARAANCTSVLIQSPWIGAVHHDFVLPTLESAVDRILQLRSALPLALT